MQKKQCPWALPCIALQRQGQVPVFPPLCHCRRTGDAPSSGRLSTQNGGHGMASRLSKIDCASPLRDQDVVRTGRLFCRQKFPQITADNVLLITAVRGLTESLEVRLSMCVRASFLAATWSWSACIRAGKKRSLRIGCLDMSSSCCKKCLRMIIHTCRVFLMLSSVLWQGMLCLHLWLCLRCMV